MKRKLLLVGGFVIICLIVCSCLALSIYTPESAPTDTPGDASEGILDFLPAQALTPTHTPYPTYPPTVFATSVSDPTPHSSLPKATSTLPVNTYPTSTVMWGCSADIYNCSDFTTQARAQAVYNFCKQLGQGDVHYLDKDEDGVVCESLP